MLFLNGRDAASACGSLCWLRRQGIDSGSSLDQMRPATSTRDWTSWISCTIRPIFFDNFSSLHENGRLAQAASMYQNSHRFRPPSATRLAVASMVTQLSSPRWGYRSHNAMRFLGPNTYQWSGWHPSTLFGWAIVHEQDRRYVICI